MSKDAFDLKTTVVPDNAGVLVTQLGRRTTIHHLPVEILAEIFVHCIPILVPGKWQLPSLEIYPSEIRDILSDVCRLWSMIIDREPRVWATLILDYGCPTPEAFSLSLKKSKSCLLDVYIDKYMVGPDMVCTVNLSSTAYIFIPSCDSFLSLQDLSTASSYGSAPFSRLNIS